MDTRNFTSDQINFFSLELNQAFLNSGFEIVEEPHFDCALGFRATYIKRYVGHRREQLFPTLLNVVGLPFGKNGQKMVILSLPKFITNEPICEAIKLRVQFNDTGQLFATDLSTYVAHIIETISPGLIQLPIEMKLEILKKLSVESIIHMAQVNSEFKSLIFLHGETLWRHLCNRDFNVTHINRRVHRFWKELYKDLYILDQLETCRKRRALMAGPELLALPAAPGPLPIEWHLHPLVIPDQDISALELLPRRRSDSVGSLS